jgi:GTPase SAR1 family protein
VKWAGGKSQLLELLLLRRERVALLGPNGCGKTTFLKTVVEGWQVTAKALGSVPEMVILGIFPGASRPSSTRRSLSTFRRWPISSEVVPRSLWKQARRGHSRDSVYL